VSLRSTDLHLVGVVGSCGGGSLFDVPVYPPATLGKDSGAEIPFGAVVVMPLESEDDVRTQLETAKVPTRVRVLAVR